MDPPEISEFTFANLYAWRRAYDISLSALDTFLILRAGRYGAGTFFAPVGKGDIKRVITRILLDTRGTCIRTPETIARLCDKDGHFDVVPDSDNSDYVFRVEDLVALSGKKYDGKRNLIKKFRTSYAYEYVPLDGDNAGACLAFEDAWCSVKSCDSVEGLRNERVAIGEMISSFEEFGLTGGMISIGGEAKAAAVAGRLNPDTLVMHILKAAPDLAGLYQTMLHEFLSREARGFKLVNLEQDLGVEGLRKAKLSYHPSAMVKKYILRPRG